MSAVAATAMLLDITCSEFVGLERHNAVQQAPSAYVVVSSAKGQELGKTAVVGRQNAPSWKRVEISVPNDTDELVFSIYDRHHLHADVLLGVANVSVPDVRCGRGVGVACLREAGGAQVASLDVTAADNGEEEGQRVSEVSDEELEAVLRRIWVGAHMVSKDVPRLVRRIDVLDHSGTVWTSEHTPEATTPQLVTTCCAAVSRFVEPDRADAIAAIGAKLEIQNGVAVFQDDPEGFCRAFFDEVGFRSPVARVFHTVNQVVIFPAIERLKIGGPMEKIFTKDLAGRQGWRVVMEFARGIVVVTHVRWEQSLDLPESPDYFRFEWQLRLTFDKSMEDLQSVSLRITSVVFNEHVSDSRRSEVEGMLFGDLIVH